MARAAARQPQVLTTPSVGSELEAEEAAFLDRLENDRAGAVAVLSEEENRGRLALFAGIDGVRFMRIVRPGDELLLECTLETVRGPIGRGKARATVDGELAVRGTLTFAVGEPQE